MSEVKTEDVRKELNKCYRKLRDLRSKTKVGTKKHRYISVMMNWIWFLRRITLQHSKNLMFLDISDVMKVEECKTGNKVGICVKGEKKMSEEKKEFKPLDLTNHASQVLRKFFRQEDGDKTNYTATDLYEVLEMSENKFRQQINEVIEGLLKEIDKAIGYYTIQNALNESTFRNERIEGLKIAKELIRKYFLDVKENENERAD